MAQDAGSSLEQKALTQFVSGRRERLDGHLAAHRLVHPAVNDTHASNAQDAQDWVLADLRDWRPGIHGQTPDLNRFSRQQKLK
jgi:hypothetical protein